MASEQLKAVLELVGGADLGPGRQVRQRQRHLGVVRHQVQHPLVEAAQRLAQQAAEVGLAPGVVRVGEGQGGHAQMVRQTDQKLNDLPRIHPYTTVQASSL